MDKFFMRLQYVAALKKIRQIDIIKGLKKASSTVSNWWNGNIVPGRKNTDAIAEFIGCDPTWLRTGEGDPFPEQNAGNVIQQTTNTVTGNTINGSQVIQGSTTGDITITGKEAELLASVPVLLELAEWLEDMEKEQPGSKAWFTIEVQNKFSKFAEWKKK